MRAIGCVLRTFSGFTLASTPVRRAANSAHQLERPPVTSGCPKRTGGQIANSFTLDLIQANRHIHQHRYQRGGFYGCIPTVDIMRGVGLGNAERLRFL